MIGPLHSLFNLIELANLDGLMDPSSITLRGNKLINTEFKPAEESLMALFNRKGKRISVSDVANSICPTKRDVYFWKVNKKITNKYVNKLAKTVGLASDKLSVSWSGYYPGKLSTYREVETIERKIVAEVIHNNSSIFKQLRNLNESDLEAEKSNPTHLLPKKWIIRVLETNLKKEIAYQKLYDSLGTVGKNELLNEEDMRSKFKYAKKDLGVLVSEDSVPDFYISHVNIVGDVKTGLFLTKEHLLTVAGYALLLESLYNYSINWGAIYLITTRMYDSINIFSTGQIYLIPINDDIRKKFIMARDEAYAALVAGKEPKLPGEEDKNSICWKCRFNNYCWGKENGLP